MNPLRLSTDRLRSGDWRRLGSNDLAALFAPEVVEFLPAGFQCLNTETDQRDFLTKLSQQAEVLALFDLSGQGVGLLILSHANPDNPERHLGYLLAQHVWGQGLATGLISAMQNLCRGEDVILSGRVMLGNTASAKLLQKAGFLGEVNGDEVIYRWSGAASN